METKQNNGVDKLFVVAGQMASDFDLFPESNTVSAKQMVRGLLSKEDIKAALARLSKMDVDEYVSNTVAPSESKSRPSAKDIFAAFPGTVVRQEDMGPLLMREISLPLPEGGERRFGFIAQERTSNNGVWMPQHHLRAAEHLRCFNDLSIPVITFMDTPGADAGEEANFNNQAHTISHLIAEFAQATIPSIGIVIGNGYSGGAIPLATCNLLLSVRDGVFNTIQPRGLANISRKYNLSWQECAKYVGVSAYELCDQGYVDGVIDYTPEEDAIGNLLNAITSGITAIESAGVQFTALNPEILEHHQRSLLRFATPSSKLQDLQANSSLSLPVHATSVANVFGLTLRYMRYLSVHKRIHFSTVEHYGTLAEVQLPKGDLDERTAKENREVFQRWLENPFEIKYDDDLRRRWLKYTDRLKHVGTRRNRVGQFFRGDPDTEWSKALRHMCLDYSFHLYNLWKDSAANNFYNLIDFLLDEKNQPAENPSSPTVMDVILQPEVRLRFLRECQCILILDSVYDSIVGNLKTIAREAKDNNEVSKESVQKLLDASITSAVATLAGRLPENEMIEYKTEDELTRIFLGWLDFFTHLPRRSGILKETQQWKGMVFPRVPEPLFAIVTFIVEKMIPNYLDNRKTSRHKFDSHLNMSNIGIKDFWNRLEIAYHDLLIHDLLNSIKKDQRGQAPVQNQIIDKFFKDFEETNSNLMSADPVQFPGFRLAIEKAVQAGITPCGAITGIGKIKVGRKTRRVGALISNSSFQAGAWDMAATEKFCRLLVTCAKKRLPVVCFISSGGMNTKEGAGALFSMSILNDRITRFIRDNNLPVLFFGFGDCTGGAQASFVTHPLAQTYYFSGTNMPFAGQIVVPAYLPNYATLSNYLSLRPGAMQGLVKHPFVKDIDLKLREIDPSIPIPTESVEDVVARVLKGVFASREVEDLDVKEVSEADLRKEVKRVLIHARGCTCVKLVKKAIDKDLEVVLVQSDPDMDSVAAKTLRPGKDRLVCIGGSTSDESYLNAKSVIKVAEREECDALHPGIGFLSENPGFADLCRNHGINFVGPTVESMEWMGNKSNATNTARRLGVPVVPGSFGVLTDAASAASLAEEIGYPVILKAVHGGGGKGIKVVHDPAKFRETFLQIAAEAKSAFGSGDIYMEKFVESMRHVEIQIIRDSHGNTQVLGLRDCSVQRNNQKVIEESGSTLLPKKLEEVMYESAKKLADEVNYVGAGTVEFIFSLKDQAVYFMEMNTRLQIEHPVTEKVTNIDIVGAQFDVAGGADISGMKFTKRGYAIELRINAERTVVSPDGEVEFIPDPGTVTKFNFPKKPYIDLLSAIDEGAEISPYYDSMVIQLICKGKNRIDTIDKLIDYLNSVTVEGVSTNIPLLKRILADKQFRDGDYDTGYLPKFLARTDMPALIKEVEDMAGERGAGFDLDSLRIEGSNEIKVVAQSAGVFYTTPSPSEPEFAKAGDVVDVSKTLCLIEAMKLFRPLSLEHFNKDDLVLYDPKHKYKIVRVNPANGQAVNKGDLLFVIEPL